MKFILLLSILTGTCLSLAQANLARILYYDKPAKAPDTAYMYVNGKLHGEIKLPKFEFGEDLILKEGKENQHITFSPKIIEEGQQLPLGLPSVKVSKNWKKTLLVAVKDSENKLLPIQVYAINANDTYFGNCDFLFINLTPNLIVGTFGKENILVPPKNRHVQKMSDSRGDLLNVKLDYVRPNDNNKRRWMVYQGWRILPDRRTLVFFYMPKTRTSMKYFATQIKNF